MATRSFEVHSSSTRDAHRAKEDWICSDPECNNLNFARRTNCNLCGKEKEAIVSSDHSKSSKKLLGHEIGKAAAEKSRGLFSADDWQCNRCGNVNWARRQSCNMCNAPKFGDNEERTGLGGGYNDREVVEYVERRDSDDEYDDFGRKKKKYRSKESSLHESGDDEKPSSSNNIDEEVKYNDYEDDDDDDNDDDDDDGDLSKYQLDDEDEDDDGCLSKYDLSDLSKDNVSSSTSLVKVKRSSASRSRSRSPAVKSSSSSSRRRRSKSRSYSRSPSPSRSGSSSKSKRRSSRSPQRSKRSCK